MIKALVLHALDPSLIPDTGSNLEAQSQEGVSENPREGSKSFSQRGLYVGDLCTV